MRHKKLLMTVIIGLLSLTLIACKRDKKSTPTFAGVANTSTPFGVEFDVKAGVTAFDEVDGDLTSKIEVAGTVNHLEAGKYTLNYTVKNSNNLEGKAVRVVTVLDSTETALANGWYNMKYATADTRHTFFAAAEGWLLENAYAGIPLAAQTGLSMQHARIVLPVKEYIPSFGWGTNFSTVTQDDLKVATDNGGELDLLNTPAVAGNKTLRTWAQQEPNTLNYYLGESTTESDYGAYLNGSFYTTVLNAAKNGWEFAPELASGEPVAINPVIVNGKTTSRTWEIPMRSGLKWAYNAGTDTSGFPAGHDNLTAKDFEYTYRLALDNEWFRAVSGGSDFVSKKIKGAEEYAAAVARNATKAELDTLWANFGIHASDDGKTLRLEYTESKSTFDIMYTFAMPAVNKALYESDPENYGTAGKPETVASSGMYRITYWEPGVGSRYEKVATHPLAKDVVWTHESIKILTGTSSQDQAFEAFGKGLLDSVGVPNARVDEFKEDPRVLRSPGASIWSLNINMVGTKQAQQAQWPGSTYEPEPILGNKDFRLALYFSLNRDNLVNYDAKTFPTGMKVSEAYYVDPEGGIPYRATEQALEVGKNLAYSTNGYDAEAAQALFKRAVEAEIANGNYKKGTADKYTEITLEVLTFDEASGSAVADNWMNFAQDGFQTLIDTENFVKVIMKPVRTPGSKIYDMIAEGEYDLALSSISGNTLDAASFLDVFISDNRSGFLLNYGYDSSDVEIEVEWTENGVTEKAMFSFNGIFEVLNGNVFIKDGNKITEYATVDSIIDIYMTENDLTGGTVRDTETGTNLLPVYGVGAPESDKVLGVLVELIEDGKAVQHLFVITETNGVYELYRVVKLDFEAELDTLLNRVTEDLVNPTKTTVNDEDLAELLEWFEGDVENYDEVFAYYFDTDTTRQLVVVGKLAGLHFVVLNEEMLILNDANLVPALVAATGKADVQNVRALTDAEYEANAYILKNWASYNTVAKLAVNGFGVAPELVNVYQFDIDAEGTQVEGGKALVVLFIVAGNIVDNYYL